MSASVLALTKAKLKPSLQPRDFFVFVFGPALELDKPVVAPAELNGEIDVVAHARYLRYRTKRHVGHPYLWNIDLANFFPTITKTQVTQVFEISATHSRQHFF